MALKCQSLYCTEYLTFCIDYTLKDTYQFQIINFIYTLKDTLYSERYISVSNFSRVPITGCDNLIALSVTYN